MLSVSAAELAAVATAVSADEVERAKAQLRANLLMARESVSASGDALARQIMLFGAPQSDKELLAAIDGLDPGAISAMAGRILESSAPAVAVVGPKSDVMSNAELARLLAA